MSREYETVYVLKADLPEARLVRVKEKISKIISDQGGEIITEKDWGKRALAYKIEKASYGHYFFLNYKGDGAFIAELERILKLEEDVIRFLTMKLDPRKVASAKGKVSQIEEGKLKNEDLKVREFYPRENREYSRDGNRGQTKEVVKEAAVEAEGGESA